MSRHKFVFREETKKFLTVVFLVINEVDKICDRECGSGWRSQFLTVVNEGN